MLENCTISDIENYKNGVNNFKSRKAAKLSTYKVFYPKTKDVMSRLRNNETQVQMPNNISVDASHQEASHDIRQEAHEIPSPKTEVSQVAVINDSTVNFLPKEVYEQRLVNKNVVSFNNLKGNNTLVGNKRLRVKPPVNETCIHVTNTNGIENELSLEENNQEVQNVTKQQVDFGQILSAIPKDDANENEVSEPKIRNIDDYFKKETSNLSQPPISDTNTETTDNILSFEEIKRKIQLLNEKKANIKKVDLAIREADDTISSLEENVRKFVNGLDDDIERSEEEELEKTTQLNLRQARIIQMQDLLNRGNIKTSEYEETYGGRAM